MKKLLTVLLSTLMAFSLGICASADDGQYNVSVEATQNESGDLLISATGDDAEKLINTIYEGCEPFVYKNGNPEKSILVTVGDNWTGTIQNIKNETPIITKNESGKLVVAKDALVDGNFVNGTNKLVFWIDGKAVANTTVELSGLNDAPTPNAIKYMSINYALNIPAIGKEATNPIVRATDENGNVIVQDHQDENGEWIEGRFYTYWAKKVEDKYSEDGYRYQSVGDYKCDDSDNCSWIYPTFEEGQTYYLIIDSNYIENMSGEKASTQINTAGDVSKVTIFKGATGGNKSYAYFSCWGSSQYAIEYQAKHVYGYSYDIENADKIWLAGAGIAPTEDNAFVVMFNVKNGYSAPKKEDLTVTVGGVKTSEFTYEVSVDSETGVSSGHICIDSNHVTGDVTISGKCVKNEVEAKVEGNAPKTVVEGTQEELNNKVALTEEEINAGATVYLTVNDSKSVKEEDKTLVNNNLSGNTLGEILNISLVKEVNSNTSLVQPKSELKISVDLKDSLVNKDTSVERTYSVIRVHDGETTILPATYDETTKKVTFSTDKFSTYAIVYKDTKKKETSNTNNGSSSPTCEEYMNSKNWTWSESKKACVYRVTSTSVK